MSSSAAVVPVVSMLLQSSLHERFRQPCTCCSAFVSGKNRRLILKFNYSLGPPEFDV
ncbi:unnamed protein product, partial [Musa textilis]